MNGRTVPETLQILFMFTLAVMMMAIPLVVDVNSGAIASFLGDQKPEAILDHSGDGRHVGESVHIDANDRAGSSWSVNVDAKAAGSGIKTDRFQLLNSFVPPMLLQQVNKHPGQQKMPPGY